MVVVLPAPFGPSRPASIALLDHEVDAVECGEVAEALDEALGDDTLHAADGTRTLANATIPIAPDRAPFRAQGATSVTVTVSPSPYDPEHVGRARHRALRARRAQALRDAVAAGKQGDPLSPVSVVVPTNYVGVAARRMLGSGALGPVTDRGVGIAGVTFLTVYRVAEMLGAPRLAGGGAPPGVHSRARCRGARCARARAGHVRRGRPASRDGAGARRRVPRAVAVRRHRARPAHAREQARGRGRARLPRRTQRARRRVVRRARPDGHRRHRDARRQPRARRSRRDRALPPAGPVAARRRAVARGGRPRAAHGGRGHHRRGARRRGYRRRAHAASASTSRPVAAVDGRRTAPRSSRRPIPTTRCVPRSGW